MTIPLSMTFASASQVCWTKAIRPCAFLCSTSTKSMTTAWVCTRAQLPNRCALSSACDLLTSMKNFLHFSISLSAIFAVWVEVSSFLAIMFAWVFQALKNKCINIVSHAALFAREPSHEILGLAYSFMPSLQNLLLVSWRCFLQILKVLSLLAIFQSLPSSFPACQKVSPVQLLYLSR